MKNEKTKVLKSLGWTDEQLRMIESTPSSKAFEKRLMEEVLKSLEIAGQALWSMSRHIQIFQHPNWRKNFRKKQA